MMNGESLERRWEWKKIVLPWKNWTPLDSILRDAKCQGSQNFITTAEVHVLKKLKNMKTRIANYAARSEEWRYLEILFLMLTHWWAGTSHHWWATLSRAILIQIQDWSELVWSPSDAVVFQAINNYIHRHYKFSARGCAWEVRFQMPRVLVAFEATWLVRWLQCLDLAVPRLVYYHLRS